MRFNPAWAHRTALLVAITVLAAAFPAGTLPAQPAFERGVLYRSEDPAFEIWIPRGLSATGKRQVEDKTFDEVFLGSRSGLFQIGFSTCPVDNLDDFVTATRNGAESKFPGCESEVHEGEKAGTQDAVIVVFTNLSGKPRYQGYATISTGVRLPDTVLTLGAYCSKERIDSALEQLRRMLATLRRTDRDALDRDLASRRLDKATGLSYRPPRDARETSAGGEDTAVFAGHHKAARYRLSVLAATESDAGKLLRAHGEGLARIGVPWSLPAQDDGPRCTCALYRGKADEARTVIVAAFAGGGRFVIRADGPFETRESMTRDAERMALTLRRVDMIAARAEVAAAVATLEVARKKRRKAEVAAQVQILARHAYIDEAAAALIGSLRALDDPAARIQAASALTASDDADLLPELLKAVRIAKSRRQQALLVELLEALGTIRGEKAVGLLLDFARRGTTAQSAAAIRSLGHYEVKRDRVVKGLIKAMARAEADARKNDFKARERWVTIGPAYRHALEQLTGERFASAAAAKAWLCKR